MTSENVKYTFYQKDDMIFLFFGKGFIKAKLESPQAGKKLNKNEIRLRSRSFIKKIKPNKNFDLNHILLCLSVCSKECRCENNKYRKIPSSIDGINCDKIGDFLFASQRLTNRLNKKYNIINKLKELNIGLIVNCQEKGEHPLCGTVYNDGLDIEGFSYSIKELQTNGINVLCCGWKDYNPIDSFYPMIKIVKKIYYYIHSLNKKVLAHCHAGFGRTAISLVCYKIFEKNITAENARKEIRVGARKNCLASSIQFRYCQEFAKFIEITRENFFEKNKKDITIFKINEKTLDVGNYKFTYFNDENFINYIPLFLLNVFDRIIQIKDEKKLDEKSINDLLIEKEIKKEDENIIEDLIKEINNYNWEVIKKCQDIKLLSKLLFKWLNNSIKYVINPKNISLINKNDLSSDNGNINDSTKNILNFLKKFLNLLKSNKDDKDNKLKDFVEILIPSLLGYSQKEKKEKNIQENIDKLRELIY